MQSMSKSKLYTAGCLLAGAIMLVAVQAQAVIIEYEVATGSGGWDYTYTYNVSLEAGETSPFDYGYGFNIEFDETIFSNIQDYNYEPFGDWELLTTQPDSNLHDVGSFDAYSLADPASLADPFTVNVNLITGITSAPGSQLFTIYDTSFATIASGNTILAGQQQPVPEPGTMLLMGTGLAGLIGGRLRKKKK